MDSSVCVLIVFKDDSDKFLGDVEAWDFEDDNGFILFNTRYAGCFRVNKKLIKYFVIQ